MKTKLIFQLLKLAISLAATHIDTGKTAEVLLEMIRKAIRAYEDHTGKPLDPQLIKPAQPL